MNLKERSRVKKIIELLTKEYPGATITLIFENPLELLIATILSAQCTDERVNRVSQSLFKKYKSVEDYARVDLNTFEQEIRSTGFYKNKAKNIIDASRKIIKEFGGRVPSEMEDLIVLPGVGRKTANIVLTFAFRKIEGIAVDTHVKRLSQRLGLSKNDNPDKIEQDLMELTPKRYWGKLNSLLIEHGRKICFARNPLCEKCALKTICPSFGNFLK